MSTESSFGLPWERSWAFAVRNYFGLCAAGVALRTSKYCFILDRFVNKWTVAFFFWGGGFGVFKISFKHSEPHRHSPFITKSG
jgi:hypothetical protein